MVVQIVINVSKSIFIIFILFYFVTNLQILGIINWNHPISIDGSFADQDSFVFHLEKHWKLNLD
jgi:hypothetical protein